MTDRSPRNSPPTWLPTRQVRDAGSDFYFVRPGDSLPEGFAIERCYDVLSEERRLEQIVCNPLNLATLRAVVRDHPVGRSLASSSDREIISLVARWLSKGELLLVRAPMLAFAYAWEKDAEQAVAALQAAAPAKIFSLQIVDDASDDPMGDLLTFS